MINRLITSHYSYQVTVLNVHRFSELDHDQNRAFHGFKPAMLLIKRFYLRANLFFCFKK